MMETINLKDVKINPEVFEFNRGMEDGKIELMRCKSCLSLGTKEGKLWCNENNAETKYEEHCSYWTEKLAGKEEKEIYLCLIEVLKYYIDTKTENYIIISLWIMGTYLHDKFPTYPYLFINAMKGSGKTRLLKLIKELSWKGDMLSSLSEAVLFRTSGTLCIDEFEGIGSKDKNALRELLNTAYKKGGKVKRMRKKKSIEGEEQVVEEFNTFRPIVMANIWGMEEVLGDRCISIILEKSDNQNITRKIEDFENDSKIQQIKAKLASLVSLCRVVTSRNVYMEWNNYIEETTLNNTTTLTTLNDTQQHTLFNEIFTTGINGRNLELTFPLLLISNEIGIIQEVIDIMKDIVEEKKQEDMMEGRDVMFFEVISKQTPQEWYKISELTNIFRLQINYDSNEDSWLNSKWTGKALKRLNLILNKRRTSEGREVILDIEKAKKKMEIFK